MTDEDQLRAAAEQLFAEGNPVEGQRRLDALLSLYAHRRDIRGITRILEEFVSAYPKDSGLRSRLAGNYGQLGRKKDAIEQLDRLGELQIEAGLPKDAQNTIRQIMAFYPKTSQCITPRQTRPFRTVENFGHDRQWQTDI